MSEKYTAWDSGTWCHPVLKNFKMMCCDCSLVHTLNFRIEGRNLAVQVFRDERATAAARAAKKRKEKRCPVVKNAKRKKRHTEDFS